MDFMLSWCRPESCGMLITFRSHFTLTHSIYVFNFLAVVFEAGA